MVYRLIPTLWRQNVLLWGIFLRKQLKNHSLPSDLFFFLFFFYVKMQKLFLDGYMGLGAVRICYSLYSRLQNNSPCCWLSIKHENSTERVFVYVCGRALFPKTRQTGTTQPYFCQSYTNKIKIISVICLYWTSIRGNILK